MKDPREKELHLKGKDLNNDSSNPSENEFYVVRGPVWDRKIAKLFTDTVPQEVTACELVTNNGNSLIIACAYSSPNSTAYNTNSLNRTFRGLAERYYLNLVILGDFNYPKIDWTHCTTTTNTNDPNFMFLETIRHCFLQQYVKSPTRGRNFDNPSLTDLTLCNNDDLVLDVSVLSPLGKSDHSLIEMQVRCDINVDLKTYYYH